MKLELRGVRKSYGSHSALRGADMHCPESRALVLIGPSGGGKSTLLRLISGLENPDAGEICFDGKTLTTDEAGLHAHRIQIGFVFQSYNLFPHLTAMENILLPLVEVHRKPKGEALALADKWLGRLGLDGHASKHPMQLSGGQRQRVALARALAIEPKFLVLDEPTSALDPEMSAEVLQVVEELKREGRTLIMATHHMAFARRVADHVAFVSDGLVSADGPPGEIFSERAPERCRKLLRSVLEY